MAEVTGKKGLWLYCIIENKEPKAFDCPGIHGDGPVFVVEGGEFAALVSEEPMKKYQLVRDTLIAHQKVNEVALQTHRVLPVRFCTMTDKKEKIVDEVLVPKATEFRDKLGEIAGCDEHGLRVRWKDIDKIFKQIGDADEKVREKKQKILSLPENQRHNELIDIGHLVQEAIQAKNAETAKSIVAALSPLSANVKKNNTLGDAMVLNAAFLVRSRDQEKFDRKVDELDGLYGSDLQLKYIGPVPPFNFVEIVIKWKEEPTGEAKKGAEHVSDR